MNIIKINIPNNINQLLICYSVIRINYCSVCPSGVVISFATLNNTLPAGGVLIEGISLSANGKYY